MTLNRAEAVEIIANRAAAQPLELYKAVLAVYREPKPRDEALLLPLLSDMDEMVVSAALFALVNVYGQLEQLEGIILDMAKGDARDTGEMPIQSQAIESVAMLAERDPRLISQLLAIAEDEAMADVPRARAWQCLARLAGLSWNREFTDVLIFTPDGERAEAIKEPIRRKVRQRAISN